MDYQEALKIVDEAIAAKADRRLNNVEIAIFEGSWQGLTYDAIAAKYGYGVNYLKGDAGYKFWKLLGEALGDDSITKTNFKAVLESHQPASTSISAFSSVNLYIERPPLESICEQEILKPGALLRIKGSPKMGKTLLLSRLINFASSKKDYNAVHLPLRFAEKEDYETLDSFLKWLCISISQLLSSKYPVDKDGWDKQLGNSKMKAFNYIEEYFLRGDKPSLVLGLDDLDIVFSYKEILDDFLTWLRALHEKANTRAVWEKFRLILTYREEYTHLPIHSSPFNVGNLFILKEFNEDQVQELVNKNGLTGRLSQQDIIDLMASVSGHPFLIQRALNEILAQQSSLKEILDKAPTESGIYRQELQKQLFYLQSKPNLQEIFKKIIKAGSPVENLDLAEKNQLEGLGLIKPDNNGFVPFCQLYRNYFIEVL